MILALISFYPGTIDPAVLEYQKKVFDYFEIPMRQIMVKGLFNVAAHASAMQQVVDYGFDYYIFFDIDAIPLKKNVVSKIMKTIEDHTTLFGLAHESTHIIKPNGTYFHLYAHPSCMGFSHKLYLKLGSPTFMPTNRGDTAEELTWEIESRQKLVTLYQPEPHGQLKLKLLHPKSFECEQHIIGGASEAFVMGDDVEWRPATHSGIYGGDEVFHAKGITRNDCGEQIREVFIDKCKEVIGE